MNRKKFSEKSEKGASLVALMALMTLISIFLLAAAPTIQHEIQRQKEMESIARGEEVAEAIRQYVIFYQGRKFPRKIEDLLEGLPQGTKKRQILRASAAIDPLTKSGKWKTIKASDKELLDFQKRVFKYHNGTFPPTQNQQFFQQFLRQFASVNNFEPEDEEEPPGGEDDADDDSEGDFIGVVSRSQRKSILGYYGIERHDRWIFTPLYR